MGKYPKARVVPFSSVVGSSITLHDPESERVIGQLGIMNIGGDTPADWKARSILVADDTAKRINLHDDLVAALRETVRIAQAMSLSTGLGPGQRKRIETAQSVLARVDGHHA